MNFLAARAGDADGGAALVALDAAPGREANGLLRVGVTAPQQRLVLGIRPEHIRLGEASGPSLKLSATVERVEQLGAASFLYCTVIGGERLTVHAAGQVDYRSGAQIDVSLPLAETHVFDAAESGQAFQRR
jgi:ABC-type sugar transport system ATPase subunit